MREGHVGRIEGIRREAAGMKDLLSTKVAPPPAFHRCSASSERWQAPPAAKRQAVARLRADRKGVRYRSYRANDGTCGRRCESWLRSAGGWARRLHILLRRVGITISRKKAERLYHEEGLTVRCRKGRIRATVARAPPPVMALTNQRWSFALVHDQLATGRRSECSTSSTTSRANACERWSTRRFRAGRWLVNWSI